MSNLLLQKIVLLRVTEDGKIILKKKRPLLLARSVSWVPLLGPWIMSLFWLYLSEWAHFLKVFDFNYVFANQSTRAATSTDFRNRLNGPPNSNRIRLTERFASPYEALCFHMFSGSDSQPGPSRLSWQIVPLLVSNQTSFMQIKQRSKTMTCSVLMHENKSLPWCHSPTVSSRIKQGKESCYSHRCNQWS